MRRQQNPQIKLSSPINWSVYTEPANIYISATVSPLGHTINKVQFFNGTTLLSEIFSGSFTYLWSNVTANTYTLSAKLIYDGTKTITSSPVSTIVIPNPSGSLPPSGSVSGSI
jgi:hypothetical protein